jgi:hypothetical protein
MDPWLSRHWSRGWFDRRSSSSQQANSRGSAMQVTGPDPPRDARDQSASRIGDVELRKIQWAPVEANLLPHYLFGQITTLYGEGTGRTHFSNCEAPMPGSRCRSEVSARLQDRLLYARCLIGRAALSHCSCHGEILPDAHLPFYSRCIGIFQLPTHSTLTLIPRDSIRRFLSCCCLFERLSSG